MAITSNMSALEQNVLRREDLSADHLPRLRFKPRGKRRLPRLHQMGRENAHADRWLSKVDAQLRELNDAIDRFRLR